MYPAELIRQLAPANRRQAKANDSYYLLKKTSSPTVIVECGFLSNPTEADLLCDPEQSGRLRYLFQCRFIWTPNIHRLPQKTLPQN